MTEYKLIKMKKRRKNQTWNFGILESNKTNQNYRSLKMSQRKPKLKRRVFWIFNIFLLEFRKSESQNRKSDLLIEIT